MSENLSDGQRTLGRALAVEGAAGRLAERVGCARMTLVTLARRGGAKPSYDVMLGLREHLDIPVGAWGEYHTDAGEAAA